MDKIEKQKTCKTCKKTKPLSEFYALQNARDGHHQECKECLRRRTRINIARRMELQDTQVCNMCHKRKSEDEFSYGRKWCRHCQSEYVILYKKKYVDTGKTKRKLTPEERAQCHCVQDYFKFDEENAVVKESLWKRFMKMLRINSFCEKFCCTWR